MNEREKLIEELVSINNDANGMAELNLLHDIAEFILADRKRIVEPLIEAKNYRIANGDHWPKGLRTNDAIDETINRAGIQ